MLMIYFESMDELEGFTRRREYIDFRIELVRHCVRGSTKAYAHDGEKDYLEP